MCGFLRIGKKKVDENHEKEQHAKNLDKKYKDYLTLLKELNYLNFKKKNKNKENKAINFFSLFGNKIIQARISQLSDNSKDGIENKNNFNLLNYELPFLPTFIKMEVMMMYGSYEIHKSISRLYIISNVLKMNEKITFNNLLVSI